MVCARIADYPVIGSILALDVDVEVQSLDDAQIDCYLAWAGEPLAGVGAVLAQDAELRELARAPLILNIIALAYQGQRPEELVGLAATKQRRRQALAGELGGRIVFGGPVGGRLSAHVNLRRLTQLRNTIHYLSAREG